MTTPPARCLQARGAITPPALGLSEAGGALISLAYIVGRLVIGVMAYRSFLQQAKADNGQ